MYLGRKRKNEKGAEIIGVKEKRRYGTSKTENRKWKTQKRNRRILEIEKRNFRVY